MASENEFKDQALVLLFGIISIALVGVGLVAQERWVVLVAGVAAGIFLVVMALGLVVVFGERQDQVRIQDELCPHFSANTLTDSQGDVYHFCDDCGEQVSRFNPMAGEEVEN
jgi:hypothetical protein